MGAFISRFFERLRGMKEVRLLMLGLDNAGKTTILYKLKFNQTVTTIPTAGFNVECLVHKGVKFHVWDVGGQDKIRPLWRHYHTGTKALIFVIDSQDRDRIHEARIELHRILSARELQDAVLLIFANKQDLSQSMTVDEIRERLHLEKFPRRVWTLQPSCATTGDGLLEGLNWLAEKVKTSQITAPNKNSGHAETSAPLFSPPEISPPDPSVSPFPFPLSRSSPSPSQSASPSQSSLSTTPLAAPAAATPTDATEHPAA